MTHDLVIGGVLISPIVPACLLALLVTIACSIVLIRLGLYRLVWHRPLVEVALFCIALGCITLAGQPLGLG
jgi:fatty-acid desaturase